jgi:hypothetical protein
MNQNRNSALGGKTPLHMQQKQRSFLSFGFNAGASSSGNLSTGSGNSSGLSPILRKDTSSSSGSANTSAALSNNGSSALSNLNLGNLGNSVASIPPPMPPSSRPVGHNPDTPEIRKYKKRFNSEILCAALWGVNLLIGTENGNIIMLLISIQQL